MTAKILIFAPRPDEKAVWTGGDSPIMDQTPYPDPPMEEYLASAGYETSSDTSPCK